MASTYLTRTPSSAGNRKTWTWSGWVKRSGLGGEQNLLAADNNNRIIFSTIDSNDQFGLTDTNTSTMDIQTNQVFRDVSAWYHLVVSFDSTQATASNRVKLYVNGSQVTSLARSTYPTQNADFSINNNTVQYIGSNSASSNNFNGSMAHVHFIDGTAYDADDFGETDSLTGIWKPKTAPSVTYGTNGFFLKFENSGAFGTDSSGNANTFTVNGTMTQNIDTPSNVFATLNPLSQGVAATSRTFSNGNTSVTLGGADDSSLSSIGVSSGKWYAEFKITNDSADPTVGVGNEESVLVTNPGSCNIGGSTGAYGYYSDGRKKINGGSLTSYGDSFTTNDIIGIALDLTNGAIWFSKNGTWQASATISEIEAGTTTNACATSLSGTFFFGCSNSASGTTGDAFSVNFGNGYFGTTAVSSAQNPDDGIGIFEYDVPTGYYALNTKAINAQEYD